MNAGYEIDNGTPISQTETEGRVYNWSIHNQYACYWFNPEHPPVEIAEKHRVANFKIKTIKHETRKEGTTH